MQIETLQELYIDELRDLYSAEAQILKALPKVTKYTTNPELRSALTEHERVTRGHVARLERIFKELGEKPTGKTCEGMKGILKEESELIDEKPDPELLDAGIIGKAQSVEHYEIAGYGTACEWAMELGFDTQAQLLEQTLAEEKEADETLTRIAKSAVNSMAANVSGDGYGNGGNGHGKRSRR